MSRPPGSENLLVLFLIHVGTGPGVTGTQPDSGSPTTLEAGIRFDDESHQSRDLCVGGGLSY